MRGLRAIRRRGEVCIVGATAILGLGSHRIVALAAVTEVVDLEIACGFVKAMPVQDVVNGVVQVEQVLNGDFVVVAGRGL